MERQARPPSDPGAAAPDAGAAAALVAGTHQDPFALLGLHEAAGGLALRVFRPGADTVEAVDAEGRRVAAPAPVPDAPGLFAGLVPRRRRRFAYRLRCRRGAEVWTEDDPFRFGPVLGPLDEHLLGEGSHLRLWQALGAHPMTHEGVAGTHFAVWAPAALRVSVVGDVNHWDGRRHPMRRRGATGVWETFLPGTGEGAHYKFEIAGPGGTILPLKADPVGFGSEHPPATASVVRDLRGHSWQDGAWIAERAERQRRDRPVSIYEVHAGSWARVPEEGDRRLTWSELADRLVPYAVGMGFTHLELLPVSEFPFDGSWGYQPVGLFAPTVRHGTPGEFRGFVEACHAAGLGLILDWVPGHFPSDAHGLARFDGTSLYEHEDPREGFHRDWNTLIYNYGRREVANFLIANAIYWLREHHVDGLRVDAVASMLYRDYSRPEGEWVPNVHGGRENLEAIEFLRRMNATVYAEMPGIVTIAEESTAWPGVSRPVHDGGLGFGYKWNMGWMNDTLDYMRHDPVHRRFHHHQLTFGLAYAFSENFVLPLSHDEVVHGKGSLLARMPGTEAEKFANLRAYLGFMWAHPGKKLLFMGGEFAQGREWNHDASLDWHLLDHAGHRGMQSLVRDLNRLYRDLPALHRRDCAADGFRWLAAEAADDSVLAFARLGDAHDPPAVALCHFTPVPRPGWRVGLPRPGLWEVAVDTSRAEYGGPGGGAPSAIMAEPLSWQGEAQSAAIDLPPLATLLLRHRGG